MIGVIGGFPLDMVMSPLGLAGRKGGGNGFDKARADLMPLYDQASAMYDPYVGLAGVLPQLQTNVNNGVYNGQFADAPQLERFNFNFEQDPGYKFALEEGNRGLANMLASSGMRGGTNAMREAISFNQGLARQSVNDAFNRQLQGYNATQGNRLQLGQLRSNIDQMRASMLQNQFENQMGLAGLGMGAIEAQAGLRTGLAGNLTDLQIGKYQASEAKKIAKSNNKSQLLGGLLTGAAATAPYWAPALFSDARMKENIEYKRQEKGHNIYSFNYKGDGKKYEGVLAQEVIKKEPKAISVKDGMYLVNYDMLGIKMRAA